MMCVEMQVRGATTLPVGTLCWKPKLVLPPTPAPRTLAVTHPTQMTAMDVVVPCKRRWSAALESGTAWGWGRCWLM